MTLNIIADNNTTKLHTLFVTISRIKLVSFHFRNKKIPKLPLKKIKSRQL